MADAKNEKNDAMIFWQLSLGNGMKKRLLRTRAVVHLAFYCGGGINK